MAGGKRNGCVLSGAHYFERRDAEDAEDRREGTTFSFPLRTFAFSASLRLNPGGAVRYSFLEMARRSEFITYLLEQLAPLGEVRARSMFGGFGIYLGERMFALVADDSLYLKADEANRAEFEARGLSPFRYEMRGEWKQMNYWQPPAEAMDDRELLCEWARKGCEAADRAASKKKARGPLSG